MLLNIQGHVGHEH